MSCHRSRLCRSHEHRGLALPSSPSDRTQRHVERIRAGRRVARHAPAARIDVEVKDILEVAYGRVTALLTGHMAVLDRVAEQLLEREVLDETEFKALLNEAPSTQTP